MEGADLRGGLRDFAREMKPPPPCPMRNVRQRLNYDIREVMEKITLGDILDSCRMQNAEVGFPDSCI